MKYHLEKRCCGALLAMEKAYREFMAVIDSIQGKGSA